MSDTQDSRPSLAELRAKLATVEPVFSAADRARRGTELEILAHVPTLLAAAEAYIPLVTYRDPAEYHEDFHDVLWWRLSKHSGKPEEPPYCGSPLCDDWPYGMDGDDEGDTWGYDFKGDSLKWTPLPRPYDAPGVRP